MILVLAGTKDGRIIAEKLFKKGLNVVATTVTSYGNKFSKGIKVQVGALDRLKLSEVIKKEDVKIVIDATHPFAKEVSINAITVCKELKVPYIRYERESLKVQLSENINVIWVEDFNQAVGKLECFNRIFLTIGSKNLDKFLPLKTKGKKIFARVLPLSSVIKRCEDLGFSCDEIIAMQGPFSREMNLALFKQTKCDVIVTKESGKVGGVLEKIQAAGELDIPIVVIKRPKIKYPRVFYDISKLVEEISIWLSR